MKKVSAPKVVTTLEASESPLPPQIQEALGETRRGSERRPARAQRRGRSGRRA